MIALNVCVCGRQVNFFPRENDSTEKGGPFFIEFRLDIKLCVKLQGKCRCRWQSFFELIYIPSVDPSIEKKRSSNCTAPAGRPVVRIRSIGIQSRMIDNRFDVGRSVARISSSHTVEQSGRIADDCRSGHIGQMVAWNAISVCRTVAATIVVCGGSISV